MKQNMHTHTVYCDGKNTPEEMVRSAIAKGFDVLGFSGHGHCAADDCAMRDSEGYIREILRLKEMYKEQIDIVLGVEEDLLEPYEEKEPFAYIIGSAHFLKVKDVLLPIDYSREVFERFLELFDHDFLKLAAQYYENVYRVAIRKEVDIIGHFDLLMKFNEEERYLSFEDPQYLELAYRTMDAIGYDKIYEVNTGAIARGYRKTPYPHVSLLRHLYEHGGKVMLNSDCHDADKLDCAYTETLAVLKEIGFRELYTYRSGFVPVPIEEYE